MTGPAASVLLVSCGPSDDNHAGLEEPLGLASLAAYLRRGGHHAEVWHVGEGAACAEAVAAECQAGAHDVVGLTLTPSNPATVARICRAIKESSPAVLTVVGGHLATALHRDVVGRFAEIDVVCRGEGEITLLRLVEQRGDCRNWHDVEGLTFRDGGRIVTTAGRERVDHLDALPFPVRDVKGGSIRLRRDPATGTDRRAVSVVTSRGCPKRCDFCSIRRLYSDSGRPAVRLRGAENVADEIESLVRGLGVGHIDFVDDNFLVAPRRVAALFDELGRRELSFDFTFLASADLIVAGAALLKRLKAAGLVAVEVGLESGSERMLGVYNKGVSVAQNREAVRLLRQEGIAINYDFIMFSWETTLDDLRRNLEFLHAIDPLHTVGNRARAVLGGRLIPYPGTPAFERLDALGVLDATDPFAPTYRFRDGSVARVQEAIGRFLDGVGQEAGSAVSALERLIETGSRGPAANPREAAGWVLDRFELLDVPYAYFRGLVENASQAERLEDFCGRALPEATARVERVVRSISAGG
jgi:radical SAM superfamily enzyme YgiQ (UPF0313 family)